MPRLSAVGISGLQAREDVKSRQAFRYWVSLIASILLVLGQLSVSAHACSFAKQAFGHHASAIVASTGMHCQDRNDMHPHPSKDSTSKVCQDHCAQPAQLSHTTALEMPVYGLVAWFPNPRPILDTPKLQPAGFDRLAVLAGGSPPLRIQYQIFRI